jgi:hypothetical protein
VAGWLRGRVTLCAVCTVHVETRSASFLIEPQNQGQRFVSGLASKPVATVLRLGLKIGTDGFSRFGLKTGGGFLGWASKSRWWRISRFSPQNWQLRLGDLGLKTTTTVSWFGPQNQADYGLSVVPQNRREGDDVGHTSRSSRLLCVEVNQARVSQSGLKTDGGVTAGGARDTIVEVMSESSWKWTGRYDRLR